MRLDDTPIVVTGATGIARASAERFVAEGPVAARAPGYSAKPTQAYPRFDWNALWRYRPDGLWVHE